MIMYRIVPMILKQKLYRPSLLNLPYIPLLCMILKSGTAHAFIKGGRITVPSTSCNTGLDLAIFEINKNFSMEAG